MSVCRQTGSRGQSILSLASWLRQLKNKKKESCRSFSGGCLPISKQLKTANFLIQTTRKPPYSSSQIQTLTVQWNSVWSDGYQLCDLSCISHMWDACGNKVENKSNVTRRKKVTKRGLKKIPKSFKVPLFQLKSVYAGSSEVMGIFTGCWTAWLVGVPASPSDTRSVNPWRRAHPRLLVQLPASDLGWLQASCCSGWVSRHPA